IERAPCRAREEISAGGATLKRGSGVARLPVVFEIAAELAAAERDNRIGAADGPEHPGLLEAAADDGLAASLHNPGPDKQALSPELRVAHAFGIGFEVSGFGANHIDHFGRSAASRSSPQHTEAQCHLVFGSCQSGGGRWAGFLACGPAFQRVQPADRPASGQDCPPHNLCRMSILRKLSGLTLKRAPRGVSCPFNYARLYSCRRMGARGVYWSASFARVRGGCG